MVASQAEVTRWSMVSASRSLHRASAVSLQHPASPTTDLEIWIPSAQETTEAVADADGQSSRDRDYCADGPDQQQ